MMKTVSIPVDHATWQAATQAAEVQHTTLGEMVAGFVQKIAAQQPPLEGQARRAQARKALVDALTDCQAVVGETPTRERTYAGRRFHRH